MTHQYQSFWEDSVRRVPGGLKGLSPTSPPGTSGAKRTQSRQSPGVPGGPEKLSPTSPKGIWEPERTESHQSLGYSGA